MNYKICLFVLSLFMLCAGNALAQNPAPVIKEKENSPGGDFTLGEIRGNVKRKAVYLPKPLFPREAIEAGADGGVKVQVTIDADGNVISAETISGHPLLKAAAEDAARQTKFKKADETAQNGRETGVLIYNFAIEKAGWLRIGYDLSIIQKAPSLRPLNVPRTAKAFQAEWTEEKELLEKIAGLRRIEIETQSDDFAKNKPVLVKDPAIKSGGAIQQSMRAEIRLPIQNPPSGERIALSQNLIAALQARLANDESSLWKFNLGVNLTKAFELSRNPAESKNAAQILRQSAETAPSDIPAEALTALQNLIKIYENGKRTSETLSETGKSMTILFRMK